MGGLKVAVTNGNWSNPAIWDSGVKPAAGDVVASNGFTVVIDENFNVDSITNSSAALQTAIPIMTSDTTPSGVVFSSPYGTTNYAWKAFDASTADGFFSNSVPTVSVPVYLGYEFTSAKIITKYYFQAHAASMTYSPKDFTFQGWNGTSWVILHTVTGHNAITYTSPDIGNTTAYTKYQIVVTANGATGGNTEIKMFQMYEKGYSTLAIAGGTFTLNSGVTVTCTGASGITAGNSTCLTYSGSGTSTINANINPLTVNAASLTFTLVHNGTGTLNINGNIYASSSSGNRCCLDFSSSGTLNIVGILYGGFGNTPNARATGSGILTIVGNVTSGSNVTSLDVSGTVNATITGTISGGTNSGRAIFVSGSAILNVTGNLVANQGGSAITISGGSPQVTVTGTVGSITQSSTGDVALNAQTYNAYVKIIGIIYGGDKTYNFYSAGTSAINLLTGPFVSHPTGIQPIYLARMHYFRTMGSYFEFRDNSTNGALPPAGSAPATRLVSPDTAVDAPSPANVRFGTVYSLGSQTGTMKVPAAANVRLGVEVDNTTGTAVLGPEDVWNYLRTSMNTPGSIGERLKDVSTVDSTGTQIASITI